LPVLVGLVAGSAAHEGGYFRDAPEHWRDALVGIILGQLDGRLHHHHRGRINVDVLADDIIERL